MQPITLDELVPYQTYEKTRDQSRGQLLAHKAVRRVELGDKVSVTFETRETMLYQIHEMMRVEKLTAQEAIARELAIYNDLVPSVGQLSATVFVAVVSDAEMREWLTKLVGVDEELVLEFGGHRVRARSEPGRNREDKTSAVHYVWFDFTPEEAAAFQSAAGASLLCTHPNYRVNQPLSRDTFIALRDDLGR